MNIDNYIKNWARIILTENNEEQMLTEISRDKEWDEPGPRFGDTYGDIYDGRNSNVDPDDKRAKRENADKFIVMLNDREFLALTEDKTEYYGAQLSNEDTKFFYTEEEAQDFLKNNGNMRNTNNKNRKLSDEHRTIMLVYQVDLTDYSRYSNPSRYSRYSRRYR